MVFPRIHPAVSPFSCENVAKHLNISGNPLEPELLLVLGKPLTIGRVMTSLLVITFRIGQSVGKASTSVYDKDTMLPQRRLFQRDPILYCQQGRIARVLVHDNGLVHRSELKVQSGPW